MIITSGDDKAGLDEIGIKTAALNHMRKLSLPVPDYRVLSAAFFEAYAHESGFLKKAEFVKDELSDTKDIADELRKIIADTPFPQRLVAMITETVKDLKNELLDTLSSPMTFSVRASQPYVSALNSPVAQHVSSITDIERGARAIYAHHFSKEALDERLEKGLPLLHTKIAVIVQVFVKPDVSGIIVPIPDRAETYAIAAWKGFGHHLDFHIADHYIVRHHDRVMEKFLNNKRGEMFFFDETQSSVTRTSIAHTEAEQPFLNHDQIIDLVRIYAERADELGGLGIEFCVHDDKIAFITLKDERILNAMQAAMDDLLREEQSRDEPEESDAMEEQDVEAEQEGEEAEEYEEETYVASGHVRAVIDELIEKYVQINPTLERTFGLLRTDIDRELTALEDEADEQE